MSPGQINGYIQSLQLVSEAAKNFGESLKNDDDITVPMVMIRVMENIPVLGDIVNLFIGQNNDISEELNNLKKQLEILSNNQDEILSGIKSLHIQIDYIPIKSEITTRSVEINSCFEELNYFLRFPDMKSRQHSLHQCAFEIKPGIRFIADLLNENRYSKIFKQMIETDKYCNSSNIMGMHRYLFALYFTGCEAVIASEAIAYNGSYTNMLEECNTNFEGINSHLQQIFYKCTHDDCDTITSILKGSILQNINNPTKVIWHDATSKFPWFFFQFFELSGESNVTLVGNQKPSSVTFHYNATLQFFIAWTPYKTLRSPDKTPLGFSYELNSKNIVKDFTSMNVSSNYETTPAIVMGYVMSRKFSACSDDLWKSFPAEISVVWTLVSNEKTFQHVHGEEIARNFCSTLLVSKIKCRLRHFQGKTQPP
ncbi:unnamed protein product [Mytilus coruscus]|uniref:Uncharacterized protein n=1 Tax=Mytilus coruscus TaxID=42192 RepID=A0A6J8CBI4_MYTCO|nr:unnamed protein product [Mytilus coruscus]